MFCYQCQETAKGSGCTNVGVCGKKDSTADKQDAIVLGLKKIALYANALHQEGGTIGVEVGHFTTEALFTTITNANFDNDSLDHYVRKADITYQQLKNRYGKPLDESALHQSVSDDNPDADAHSLHQLVIYGLKGLAAYTVHAYRLGFEDNSIYLFIYKALAATVNSSLTLADLTTLTLQTGECAVKAMALLDKANTTTFGHPVITKVELGTKNRPAILVSGHDLHDLKELLEQTEGTGVDVYTHSEMLPGHYYPELKKHKHLIGNYGGAWHNQAIDFKSFNGPILFTTNCLVPHALEGMENRVFTTNATGFPGCSHITANEQGIKNFNKIIALAKTLPAPTAIEQGTLTGGFAHHQVFSLADKIIDAIKKGAIKKFVVMGGCDGRFPNRHYYTQFAESLPKETIILTAGCAKYRYNKLNLGDINGIPRVLDAGQCNDSYSLAMIALKLQEILGVASINDLPIVFNIAWYEQKAVAVLLALLSLGVKNIHLGPTLPAFLSPNVLHLLVEQFKLNGISTVDNDIKTLITA